MLVGVLKRNYLSLKYTHIQINESERSSRGQRGKFAFKFGKRRCCFCLIGKIFPEHCTTILKNKFKEISLWPWSNVIWRTDNDPTRTILNFLQLIFQLLSTSIPFSKGEQLSKYGCTNEGCKVGQKVLKFFLELQYQHTPFKIQYILNVSLKSKFFI